jgi:hypothetical protein
VPDNPPSLPRNRFRSSLWIRGSEPGCVGESASNACCRRLSGGSREPGRTRCRSAVDGPRSCRSRPHRPRNRPARRSAPERTAYCAGSNRFGTVHRPRPVRGVVPRPHRPRPTRLPGNRATRPHRHFALNEFIGAACLTVGIDGGGSPLSVNSNMPENTYPAAERRLENAQPVTRRWFRREPGLAIVLLGLFVMLLALLIPQELRTIAFYPALVLVVLGTFLTLRHGPDQHRNRR